MESEREQALLTMDEATLALQQAQGALDSARGKISLNLPLARILITDAERFISDGLTRVERTRRYLSLARAKPISGRWPQVVTRQREDAETELDAVVALLEGAEQLVGPLRDKVSTNPLLGESIAAEAALATSRALRRLERVVRLLTEAGLGRE